MMRQWGLVFLCGLYLPNGIWTSGRIPGIPGIPSIPGISGIPGTLEIPEITPDLVQEAFTRAAEIISERRTEPPRGGASGFGYHIPSPSAPAISQHQHFQASDSRSRRLDSVQEQYEQMSRVMASMLSLTPQQSENWLPTINLGAMLPASQMRTCQNELIVGNCRPKDRYRTADGTCNNLRNPSWGMVSSCFRRLVPPNYADGISKKRLAASGEELPPPRRLSLEIHSHYNNPSGEISHMFMAWGQFLDHDFSLTPQSRGMNQELLTCCPVGIDPDPNCDPILVDPNDPFYQKFRITCLSNVRSARCGTCTVGPREQMNQITAYIDASHVYGISANQTGSLRNNDGTGTLKFREVREGGELPPKSFMPGEDECSYLHPNYDCFEIGDQRANQHPGLTSLHTLFLREHNRIARSLKKLNPKWKEETLFQEARRIVGAEMQMITYNEYLPLIIGEKLMKKHKLFVLPDDEYTRYKDTVDASLVNEFSTAAFRFGHSMINSYFPNTRGVGTYLRNTFSYPFGLYTGQLEGVVEGLMDSPAQTCDRHLVEDVTNHLFQTRGNSSGLDLAALNINRGRDHGIPGYTKLVDFCKGPKIRGWKDLNNVFRKGLRTMFENVYEQVEDIDLFSGGLAEKYEEDAIVGPTFACIIARQFYRLKYGDRFYFEHKGQAGTFTPAQLKELKKVTLAKVICDNSKIDKSSKEAFLEKNDDNPVVACKKISRINLKLWKV